MGVWVAVGLVDIAKVLRTLAVIVAIHPNPTPHLLPQMYIMHLIITVIICTSAVLVGQVPIPQPPYYWCTLPSVSVTQVRSWEENWGNVSN